MEIDFRGKFRKIKKWVSRKFLLLFVFAVGPRFYSYAQPGCADFPAMKYKMNSVVRAYQCSQASSVEECKKFLGVGEVGQITLAALAAGAIGKKVVSNMRPDNYVLCPLNFKTSQNAFDEELNFWVLQLVFGEKVFAACFKQEPLIQRNLYWGVDGDIKTIDEKIKHANDEIAESEKQKKSQEGESTQQAKPAVIDEVQISDAEKSVAEAKDRIERLNKDMGADSKIPEIAFDLKKNHPEVDKKIVSLIEAAKKPNADFNALKSELYTELKAAGLPEDKISEYFTPLAKRLNALTTIEKQKQKLKGLESALARLKSGEAMVTSHTSSSAADPADLDKKSADNRKLIELLEKKKKELVKIRSGLDLTKNLNANQLTEVAHQIYNTEAFGDITSHHLLVSGNILEGIKRDADFAAQKNSRFGSGAARTVNVPVVENGKIRASLNLKALLVKSILGAAGSLGLMSAASAANLEKPLGDAMDAVDPMAIVHMEDLGGGQCGDVVPSVLIARNPDKGCSFDMEFNSKVYGTFLNAEDSDLEALFKDPGVCHFITKNYESYYPRSTKSPVNCSSPNVVVEFSDQSRINVGKDYYLLQPVGRETSTKYDLNSATTKKFTFIEDRKKLNLAPDDVKLKYPEHYQQVTKMMAAAVEIEACCHPDKGAGPSESDCGRYGIKTGDKSVTSQNKPQEIGGGAK